MTFDTLFEMKGNFIDGKFLAPKNEIGAIESRSPANRSDFLGRFPYSYTSADEAVQSANKAFRSWKLLATQERANFLKKYQLALKSRENLICEAISREVGKPYWESKTEFSAMINKVDITINESLRFVEDVKISNIMESTDGYCRYKPHGVMVVIGPFNFPGHLANGHIVPALLTGNTVIFKPSEKSPLVGQLMAEAFKEAGFPPGVFNLVQGEKEVGRRLCLHESVHGVLFTGSYEVGTRIKQDTLMQHWKILALEMGGKNSMIVWDDAQLEVAVQDALVGGFITCGQRCSATSRIMVRKSIFEQFVSNLHDKAKKFEIGHPSKNPFMGPLIDHASVDRYLKFMGIASREGCEILMRGKTLEMEHEGYYVTPSICIVQDTSLNASMKSVYQQTEIFAPNLAIIPVDEIEEAIAQANITQYGLVASVYTQSEQIYKVCQQEINVGLMNWNRPTIGASSRLPFGGLKKSGNHFPTALSATQYCTVPVSSLESKEAQLVIAGTYPGLRD